MPRGHFHGAVTIQDLHIVVPCIVLYLEAFFSVSLLFPMIIDNPNMV